MTKFRILKIKRRLMRFGKGPATPSHIFLLFYAGVDTRKIIRFHKRIFSLKKNNMTDFTIEVKKEVVHEGVEFHANAVINGFMAHVVYDRPSAQQAISEVIAGIDFPKSDINHFADAETNELNIKIKFI